MKRVLVVDDEMLVRAGIRSLVDWQQHGYELVGEAVSGADALRQIPQLRPDILLTDLVMEDLDGISLIRECHERWPAIQCIVLSNYNDFAHVRDAMKEGAKDFLFKLTMTGEALLSVLDALKVDGQTRVKEPDWDLVRQRVGRKLIEHEYQQVEEMLPAIESARFAWDGNAWFCAMRIVVCGVPQIDLDLTHIETVISDTTSPIFPHHEVFQTSRGIIHLLFNSERDMLTQGLRMRITDLWRQIEHQIDRWWGCPSYAVASAPQKGWEMTSSATRACRQAEETLFTSKEPHLVFVPDVPVLSDHIVPPSSLSTGIWKALLANGNKQNATAFLHKLFDWLGTQHATRFAIRETIQRYAVIWQGLAGTYGIDIGTMEDHHGKKLFPSIATGELLCEVATCFHDIWNLYLEQRAQAPAKALHPAVSEVVLWIKSHPEAQVSLETLADHVHMSASYFSHLFKEDTGVPLMEYVQQHRLAYARTLIETTDLPISQLCTMAGIPNANYFSALFRKKFGMTPLEWRTKKQDSIS